MAVYSAKRDPNRCPTHPGELLSEVIPATGKSKTEIAALLGISRQHLYDVLAQRKPEQQRFRFLIRSSQRTGKTARQKRQLREIPSFFGLHL